jgi:hypothetical protein
MGNPKISVSASKADTWAVCTMSPSLIAREHARLPDFIETVHNIEGNQAHEVASALMQGRPMPKAYKNHVIPPKLLPEMIETAKAYRTFCLEDADYGYLVEQEIKLWYNPTGKGYIDFIGHTQKGFKIVDLKYGKGKAVDAFNNKQMLIYGRTTVEKLSEKAPFSNDDEASLSIFQPRVRQGDTESTWQLTVGDLKVHSDKLGNIAKKILNAGVAANDRDLVYHVDEKTTCQFCAAALICPAKNKKPLAAANQLVATHHNEVPDMTAISDEQLLKILPHRDTLKKLLDGAYKEMMRRVKATGRVPAGFKMVRGKGARSLVDERSFHDHWAFYLPNPEDIYHDPKLKSVNQLQVMLKSQGWKKKQLDEFFKDHVVKRDGQLLLVPMTDPRTAINTSAIDFMDNIEDDEDEEDLLED